MADSFRMDMSGDKSYREDALDTAMEVFDENTRSAAVVKACDHARQDKRAKEEAIRYLVKNVDPLLAAEIIYRLSTPTLPLGATITLDEDGHTDVELAFED